MKVFDFAKNFVISNISVLAIFTISQIYQVIQEKVNLTERSNKILYLISFEAMRNVMQLHPYKDGRDFVNDIQLCLNIDPNDQKAVGEIVSYSKSISYDAYNTFLQNFPDFESSDLRSVIAYYNNLSSFKTLANGISNRLDKNDFDSISYENRKSLILSYCHEIQSAYEISKGYRGVHTSITFLNLLFKK